ncbi:MAG: AIR synthase related protein [Candidatus Woesearchaeota archaeon]
MNNVDSYIEDVVKRGDEDSDLLAALSAPTLRNANYVDIVREGMNGLAVLRIDENYLCIVHSDVANGTKRDLGKYAESLVERLVESSWKIGATPVGFANVVDAKKGNKNDIETIGNALVKKANEFRIPILNGELAILGDRVSKKANISGTMISVINKENVQFRSPGVFNVDGTAYAVFDHNGKAIWINSDGVGTKTEFYERLNLWGRGLIDSLAMKLDDTIKIGATAHVVSDVVETRFGVPTTRLLRQADSLSHSLGISYILQIEETMQDRIKGYKPTAAAYNVSGSVVSTIDEERLRNPLFPREDEFLIAIRGHPNPRSNGITDRRKLMVDLFGNEWHTIPDAEKYAEYLAQPSIIFYPLFKELIEQGVATSVYHMSGGAYNGKLAKPLAKHGLYVEIKDLFIPDSMELITIGKDTPMEIAYRKYPMGNDGFITAKLLNITEAQKIIENHGLESKVVGTIERRIDGVTGVKLTAPSNREIIYFSGKD